MPTVEERLETLELAAKQHDEEIQRTLNLLEGTQQVVAQIMENMELIVAKLP